MKETRRYGEACGIAVALDHVGERWALLIVRELILGPKRFSDLQAGLPGAGAKVLTQRLKELEANDVVRRRTLPPPASSQVYELTEWGSGLEPIVVGLGRWGAQVVEPSDEYVSADSAMLRLRSLFQPRVERLWTASYEIRLGRNSFITRIVDGRMVEMRRGEAPSALSAVVTTDPGTITSIVSGTRNLNEVIAERLLTITGDGKAVRLLFEAAQNGLANAEDEVRSRL